MSRGQQQMQQQAMNLASNAVLQGLAEAEKRLDQQLDKLDNMTDDDFAKLRAQRLKKLKERQAKMAEWRAKGHGSYSEVADEKEWFREVKENERVVTHFYRPTTWRCELVDKHLTILAAKHMETRFIKINAEKSPFLVARLGIQIMPSISLAVNTETAGLIAGFTELGNTDDFTTNDLARVLGAKGLLDYEGDVYSGKQADAKSKSLNTVSGNKTGAAIYSNRELAKKYDSDDEWSD